MMSSSGNAVGRIDRIIDGRINTRPADILADLIHYCKHNALSFDEELSVAQSYVTEELGFDEEIRQIEHEESQREVGDIFHD